MSTWIIQDGERVRIPSNAAKQEEAARLFPDLKSKSKRGRRKATKDEHDEAPPVAEEADETLTNEEAE